MEPKIQLLKIEQAATSAPAASTPAASTSAPAASTPAATNTSSGTSAATTNPTQSNLPVWLQMGNYESADEDKNVSEQTISGALNRIVQFELSEKGKSETIFYSDNYNQGFTHNGKVVNGSCTEGGMKKAILGGDKYISVTNSDGETKSGVEAMADSYDSVLDLLTQSQFQKVLQEYGYGTFGSKNCGFMKHVDEIRQKYGIDIKEVPTLNPDGSPAVDGICHRTYEISLVDENGNIIEDAEGNKSTILFGDWVIPDGIAQGAEFDFISVIDEAGYDAVSKADFINNEAFASNPEFQDANGNYDPGKAYNYVINQLYNDFKNMDNGQGQYMKSSSQTINEATYTASTFTWWSAGGSEQYYGRSGLDASLLGGVASELEKAFDFDNDGVLSEAEQAKMEEAVMNGDYKHGNPDSKVNKAQNGTQNNSSSGSQGNGGTVGATQVEYTNAEFYQLQDLVEKGLAQNPNAKVEDIIENYAEDKGYDKDEFSKIYLNKLKNNQAVRV